MSEFDEIRPYNDDEVRPVLNRLLQDVEFLNAILYLKLPKTLRVVSPLLRPWLRYRLAKVVATVTSVADLQALIESYLHKVLKTTVSDLSVSGLERLEKSQAYLFVSNHRDIAMDPAFVNWVLYQNGFTTLRIAIGDNLLTKPFASDLMRLNKCFIVNRSAKAPREKLKAAKILSKYIHQSVMNDHENVWIAQREGRAKDGLDKTNSAIIGMLALSKPKTQAFAEYICEAKIVPVSISYEYDPCDADKARELCQKENTGAYQKHEHEDVQSIAKGITGFKGRVHVAFGAPLNQEVNSTDEVTAKLDNTIVDNYVLHLSNCFAYEVLEGKSPKVLVGKDQVLFTDRDWASERNQFKMRLAQVETLHRDTFLAGYANPVKAKLRD